jgi:peptidoglycan hydrolase FlgJ
MPATSPMPGPLANALPGPLANPSHSNAHPLSQSSHRPHAAVGVGTDATRDAFRDFVGQTLFGQMMQSMRSSVGKPAYFHGGRGEEVFQQQLDSVLVEKISDASASTVADPMYELFRLQRGQ